jgi:hypothetical protein
MRHSLGLCNLYICYLLIVIRIKEYEKLKTFYLINLQNLNMLHFRKNESTTYGFGGKQEIRNKKVVY